ncbi:MAG TPA: hypothetical protein VEH06_00525 [Candidatus Bathyarchaeia archaeon]|nr:hypothetical protein [Candidatus Bathyarchaeia archaeon]
MNAIFIDVPADAVTIVKPSYRLYHATYIHKHRESEEIREKI